MVLFYTDNSGRRFSGFDKDMETKNKSLAGSVLRFALKFGVAAAVVVWLIRSNSGQIIRSFQTFNYWWLIPATVFYALHIAVAAWRWRMLAQVLGVKMSGMEAFSLTMQGYFFSLVIPGGAVGGDVIKMTAVSRRLQNGSRMEGAFSVLMDRIVGMLALFIPVLIMIYPARHLLYIPQLPEYLNGMVLAWVIAGICLAGSAAGIAVFFHRQFEKIPGVKPLLAFLDRRTGGMVTRVLGATDVYGGNWQTLVKMVLTSVPGVHLLTVVPMYFLLAGTGSSCNWFTVLAALMVGNLVGLIPLFPGGIGGRDVTVIALLVAGGVSAGNAETAQLLYTGVMMVCYMAGGMFFVFDPGRKLKSAGEKTDE